MYKTAVTACSYIVSVVDMQPKGTFYVCFTSSLCMGCIVVELFTYQSHSWQRLRALGSYLEQLCQSFETNSPI